MDSKRREENLRAIETGYDLLGLVVELNRMCEELERRLEVSEKSLNASAGVIVEASNKIESLEKDAVRWQHARFMLNTDSFMERDESAFLAHEVDVRIDELIGKFRKGLN